MTTQKPYSCFDLLREHPELVTQENRDALHRYLLMEGMPASEHQKVATELAQRFLLSSASTHRRSLLTLRQYLKMLSEGLKRAVRIKELGLTDKHQARRSVGEEFRPVVLITRHFCVKLEGDRCAFTSLSIEEVRLPQAA